MSPPLSDDLKKRLEPIRKQLHGVHANSVVPFVGSGLSYSLPSWDKLLAELIGYASKKDQKLLKTRIKKKEYLLAADYLAQIPDVGPEKIQEVIYQLYFTKEPPPHNYIALANLPTAHFLTTNYDPWLENAVSKKYERIPLILSHTDEEELGQLDNSCEWVFPLHGEARRPKTCILTKQDYRELLNKPTWHGAVQSLIQTRHLFFLGTSLSEPHLEILFDKFQVVFGGRRRHWWLGLKIDPIEKGRIQQFGIDVIEYDDHGQLPLILEWLAQKPGEPIDPLKVEAPKVEAPQWFPAHYTVSQRFVGRASELQEIHRLLETQAQPVQVVGMGGIGKTLLLMAYANRFEANWPGGIFWLAQAKGDQAIVEDEIAQCLGIKGATTHARIQGLRAYLQKETRPYLWILDDIPDDLTEEQLRKRLAPGTAGRTLLSSRGTRLKSLGPSVSLKGLDLGDALQLLLGRRGGMPVENIDMARTLCEKLGYHPLALDLLAAMQADLPKKESEWIKQLDEPGQDALEMAVFLEEDLPQGYSKSVSEVLSRSLSALKRSESWDLLYLLSQVAPSEVPQDFVIDVLGEGVLRAGIAELKKHAFLEGVLLLHPLVRRVVQRKKGEEVRQAELKEKAIHVLLQRFDEIDFQDIRTYGPVAELLAHAGALALDPQTPEQALLLHNSAFVLREQGNYIVARNYEEIALLARTRLLGPEHLETLKTLNNLAGTMHIQGDFVGARELYEQALDAQIRIHGFEKIDTVTILSNFAGILYAQGELDGARQRYEQVLNTQIRLIGSEHPNTLNTLRNLAVIMRAQGDLIGARQRCEKLLAIQIHLLGFEHSDTLITLNNLAGILHAQGDLVGAHQCLDQVHDAYTRILGPKHPGTLTIRDNLGSILHGQGNFVESLKHFKQVLHDRTQLLGPEHPDTLTTLNNIASTLQAQGDLIGAQSRFEQVLDARTRILGSEHPNTLITLQNLALTLKGQNDFEGARQRYEQALSAQTRTLGPEHPDTTLTRFDLFWMLRITDPNASLPHLNILMRLKERDPNTLSAGEKHILNQLKILPPTKKSVTAETIPT